MEPAHQDPAAAQPAEGGEAASPAEGQPDGSADQQQAEEAFEDDDPTFDLNEVGGSTCRPLCLSGFVSCTVRVIVTGEEVSPCGV